MPSRCRSEFAYIQPYFIRISDVVRTILLPLSDTWGANWHYIHVRTVHTLLIHAHPEPYFK